MGILRSAAIAAVLFALGVSGASAQDQLVVVNKALAECTVPDGNSWTFDDVRRVVAAAIRRSPGQDEYFIVHVLTYTGGAAIGSQQWYVSHEPWSAPAQPAWLLDPGHGSHYRRQRIFGSQRAGIVYVYRNVQALTETRATQARTAQGVTGEAVYQASGTDEPFVKGPGGILLLRSYGDLAGLKYKIAITKKMPAPLQNVQAIAGLGFEGQGEPAIVRVAPAPITLCAGEAFDVAPLPSDMVVSAVVGTGDKEKELSKQTFDNERKYHYDFSFALPLKSFKEVSYEKTNGTLVAKEVKREALFATVNISPVAFDTKRAHVQLIPRIVYGMPITGKPLQHHLLAAAFGLNRVQVFAGVLFDRVEEPDGNALPSTARWQHAFTFGINMPVQSVVAALKPKK